MAAIGLTIGKFMARHWGKLAAISLLTIFIAWVYVLYQDNKDLIADFAEQGVIMSLKDSDVEFLEKRLGDIETTLIAIENQNQQIQRNVEQSAENIEQLDKQREELLETLESREIPESCRGQLEWLRLQAIELKREGESNE